MAKNGKKTETDSTVYVPPIIEHSMWDETPERADLFTISSTDADGNTVEKTYDMPNRPHVGLSLAMLRMARIQGGEVAMAWLLEECVGTEGFFALVAEPDLNKDVLRGIMTRARDIVLGGLEAPKA